MASLIFSFDSEDYETPASDDAELWWARTLEQLGLRGCFCLVGELARALRSRGRRDVLDAYRAHEVAFHSDMHSAHPTHAEYLEEMDWDEGVARVLREESRGIEAVREATGQHPSAYCKPGNSWGPQVAAAMPRLGVPLFCDAPLEWSPGRPMWYAGSLCLRYHHHFDGYFQQPEGRLERMKRDLLSLLEAHGDGCVVMYTHPCRLVTAAFPDNFTAGRNPAREEWRPAPLRPEAEVRSLQADFAAFLEWVARDLRPEVLTYRELYRRHDPGPERWLAPGEVRALAEELPPAPAPVEREGGWLSAAEQWSVLVDALASADEPRAVPARRLLGPVAAPAVLEEAVEVRREELAGAARRALREAESSGRIPAAVPLARADLGPATLLRACARELSGPAAPRGGRVRIEPADETPALARREDFTRLRYRNTWSIFPPDFEGSRLLELARLQAWTAKPATA